MAYNLSIGYTGILSFGHAAFFGVGAYATGIALKFLGLPLELSVLFGVLCATLVGVIIGFLAFQASGSYRAIITLAMSMVFYYIAQMWVDVTGGHDGMTGIPAVKLFGVISLTNAFTNKYYFILGVSCLCIFMQWRIVNSPFGKAMEAARENEQRAQTCGYNTYWVMWWGFVLSAVFSGAAGAMLLVFLEFCDVHVLYWMMSGTVLVITLFGGTTVFLRPFVGALVYVVMKDGLSRYVEHWEVFTGFLFVAIVLFLPKGIMGSIMDLFKPQKLDIEEDAGVCLVEKESRP
jgi:branched-chain amino acid transport system permease protein